MLRPQGQAPAVMDMSSLLQSRGVGIGPTSECYIYPPANRFPPNSFIRDSVDYFLYTHGEGKDRRVGILIPKAEGGLYVLVLEFSGFKQEIAEKIKEILASASLSETEAILKNPAAVTEFRQLYTEISGNLLGFNQHNPADIAVIQQLGALIQVAYANQGIAVNFAPANSQGPGMMSVKEILSALKADHASASAAQHSPALVLPRVADQPRAVASPVTSQATTITYHIKERNVSLESTVSPSSTSLTPSIAYDANAMLTLFKAYGIALMPHSAHSDCYVYPPLNQVALHFLIRDNVDYFLQVKGQGRDRRIGMLISLTDKQLFAFVIELSGFKPAIAKQIQPILTSPEGHTPESILQNTTMVALFRQLYTRVDCHLLGCHQPNASDKEFAQQKLEPLLTTAYATQAIHFNLISQDIHRSSVVLLEDFVSLLQEGKFTEEDKDPLRLFKKHMQQSIEVLAQRVLACQSSHAELYRQILEKAFISFKYAALLQQLSKFKTVAALEEYKRKVYGITALDLKEYFASIDVNVLMTLLNVETPELFLKTIEELTAKQFTQLVASEREIKLKILLERDTWSTMREQAISLGHLAYQSTMVPLSSILFLSFGVLMDDLCSEYPLYEVLKTKAQQLPGLLVYALTLSEPFSQHISRNLSTTLALQIVGGIFGAAWTYFLGFYAVARMMALTLMTQQAFSYGYHQEAHDQTATLSPARFQEVSPGVLGRLVGLLIAIVETIYSGHYFYLIAYSGGLLGSMTAVRIIHPEKPTTPDDVTISFLAAMSGQQIGQAVIGFLLGTYLTVNFKQQQRAEWLQRFQQLELQSEIADVKIEMPSLMNPLLWDTNRNPVTVSFRNLSSGVFYHSDCDLTPGGPECETTLTPEPLRLIHQPE